MTKVIGKILDFALLLAFFSPHLEATSVEGARALHVPLCGADNANVWPLQLDLESASREDSVPACPQ